MPSGSFPDWVKKELALLKKSVYGNVKQENKEKPESVFKMNYNINLASPVNFIVNNEKWLMRFLAMAGWAVTALVAYHSGQPIPQPPIIENKAPAIVPNDQPKEVGAGGKGNQIDHGWIKPTDEQQKAALEEIKKIQGIDPADFAKIAKSLEADDDNSPVFLWDAEQHVLKKTLPSWNQGSIGSCVSHGWGRAVQDLILTQCTKNPEKWPGAFVNREAIYGGSRVQIGGGRIGGDGSVGSWAAGWVSKYGVIFDQNYPDVSPTVDLSGGYTVSRCKSWGNSGCPKQLEAVAQKHPVKTVAMVKTSADVWAAIGNGYPVPVCSNVGFDSPITDGFCVRSGTWNHCLTIRARFIHPTKGKCFVIQNSWGSYMRNDGSNQINVSNRADPVTLPEGCFAVTASDVDAIVSQGDSFAISSFVGFPKQKLHWFVKMENNNPAMVFKEKKRSVLENFVFSSY
jgi:hypothetical protein